MDGAKYFQHVSAFQYNDCFVMTSNIKTQEGFWYLSKPIKVLKTHADPAEIGNALLLSLASAQTNSPNPPATAVLNKFMDDLYMMAGASSLNDFLQNALHCGIGRSPEGIEISPTHNHGIAHGGFVFNFENQIFVENSTLEMLSVAFLHGFAACTSVR